MTAFATTRRPAHPALRGLVAVLCVLLVLFVGTAQALHMHAQDEAANPGCSLCVVAHVAAEIAPMAAAPVFVEVEQRLAVAERSSAPPKFLSFELYVRPPPAATAHA